MVTIRLRSCVGSGNDVKERWCQVGSAEELKHALYAQNTLNVISIRADDYFSEAVLHQEDKRERAVLVVDSAADMERAFATMAERELA